MMPFPLQHEAPPIPPIDPLEVEVPDDEEPQQDLPDPEPEIEPDETNRELN